MRWYGDRAPDLGKQFLATVSAALDGVPFAVEGGFGGVPGVRMSQPAFRMSAAGSCSSRWALSTQSWS